MAATAAVATSAEAKIGVILPDTESSVRWESADRPALEKAFKDAGVDYDIQNAQGDAEPDGADRRLDDHQRRHRPGDRQPRQRVRCGDPGEGQEQGIATIDYDRLTLGGSA